MEFNLKIKMGKRYWLLKWVNMMCVKTACCHEADIRTCIGCRYDDREYWS